MTEQRKMRLNGFVAVIILMMLLTMGVTIAIGYSVTMPPRSLLVWITIHFICSVEFVASMLVLNHFVRSKVDNKPSGAAIVGLWRLLGIYLLVGIVAISAYSLYRPAVGNYDHYFAAGFASLTMAIFLVAVIVYSFDLFMGMKDVRIEQVRRMDKTLASYITPVISALEQLQLNDTEKLDKRQKLLRNLRTISMSLQHSHGGGIGSWESGKIHQDPDARANIRMKITELQKDVDNLQQADYSDSMNVILDRMSHTIKQMDDLVTQLSLS